MRINTEFKEMNFDERVAIEKVANQPIVIVNVGTMNTKFGNKHYAELQDGRWFYLTDTLEKITDKWESEHESFECTITKKDSKSGNSYWTTNLYTSDIETVSIADFEGCVIYIFDMTLVNTKYGEKNLIKFVTGDAKVYQSFTCWAKLPDMIDVEALRTDPLQVEVITKESKTGREYFSYKDCDINPTEDILEAIPEEEYKETVRTVKKPKVKKLKRLNRSFEVADEDVPF